MVIEDLAFAGGRLRGWTAADAEALVAAWRDPDIARWNSVPAEPTLAVAKNWISGVDERLEKRLSVDLVIDSEELGRVVGEVGLSGFSDRHNGALIGYWLVPAARGHGLASSAVAAMTAWAHASLELDTMIAKCHELNLASQAVARRAGYDLSGSDGSGHQLWRSNKELSG